MNRKKQLGEALILLAVFAGMIVCFLLGVRAVIGPAPAEGAEEDSVRVTKDGVVEWYDARVGWYDPDAIDPANSLR